MTDPTPDPFCPHCQAICTASRCYCDEACLGRLRNADEHDPTPDLPGRTNSELEADVARLTAERDEAREVLVRQRQFKENWIEEAHRLEEERDKSLARLAEVEGDLAAAVALLREARFAIPGRPFPAETIDAFLASQEATDD